MTLFGIVITTKKKLREAIKDILIYEGIEDISGADLNDYVAELSE